MPDPLQEISFLLWLLAHGVKRQNGERINRDEDQAGESVDSHSCVAPWVVYGANIR
jgi:hypothetical protein